MHSVPVIVLAGSDLRPAGLPEGVEGLHPLAAYKAVSLRVDGRPIVEVLVERLAATPGFGPIALAGPARVLAPLGLDVAIVDTDGSVGTNMRNAVEHHRRSGGGTMALLACDVLPTPAELVEIRERYESSEPSALWFPFVRVPRERAELGAFGWKPTYRLLPERGADPIRILPGHLGIFDPAALRLPVLYLLLDAAYRTRNLPVVRRRTAMLRRAFTGLVGLDLRELVRGSAPTRTLSVLANGLRIAAKLRAGRLTIAELERLIGRIFLEPAAVAASLGIRYPVLDVLSLAEDVDTEEEADELSGDRL